MTRPDNPRFPHWCRIIRKTTESPLVDEEDFSPLESRESEPYTSIEDYDFDPFGTDPGEEGTGGGQTDTGDTPAEEDEEESTQATIIYEGKCRSYAKNTTSDRGDVITSYRGLALPLTQDDWSELGFVPQEGDEVAVNRGAYVEYGRVIDREPANFRGTHLTWRYGRN